MKLPGLILNETRVDSLAKILVTNDQLKVGVASTS